MIWETKPAALGSMYAYAGIAMHTQHKTPTTTAIGKVRWDSH